LKPNLRDVKEEEPEGIKKRAPLSNTESRKRELEGLWEGLGLAGQTSGNEKVGNDTNQGGCLQPRNGEGYKT